MAKAAITKKMSLSASGILEITEDGVFMENTETGELIDLRVMLAEYADKFVKLSCTYDYDYDTATE